MEVIGIIVCWLIFGGTHIILSHTPLRRNLINKLGERGFKVVYSLIALVSFALLIWYFYTNRSQSSWILNMQEVSPLFAPICSLSTICAVTLLVLSIFNPSALSMASGSYEAKGVSKITRHAMNMSFAIFGLAHTLIATTMVDFVFFLGFPIFAIIGSIHQDKRKMVESAQLKEYISKTSLLPFWAIIYRKQRFSFSDLNKKALIGGLVAAIAIKIMH